jgi:hypothetical protein
MYKSADKKKETPTGSVANSLSSKHSATSNMTKENPLHKIISESAQVRQFRTLQSMADNSNRAKVFQLVKVADSRDGTIYDTAHMSQQEIIALALQFFQLHNMSELAKLQEAHGRQLNISNHDLNILARGHNSSSSLYRSLRPEENPLATGLIPPQGHNPNVSAIAHITSGSRAAEKSPWVSATHAQEVAGVWAAHNAQGKVARFQAPPVSDGNMFDLTLPQHQQQVFPSGQGSGLNAAKASKEVIIKDGIPPEYIESISIAHKMKVAQYNERLSHGQPEDGEELFKAKRKKKDKPVPVRMVEIYNRDATSARFLQFARAYWDDNITNLVSDLNDRYSMKDNFVAIDEDDVQEFLSEITDNPHRLDFIQNETKYNEYLVEIRDALNAYTKSIEARYD